MARASLRLIGLGLAALGACAGGCSSTVSGRGLTVSSVVVPEVAGAFPGAPGILSGYAIASDSDGAAVGDRVLLGVVFDEGDQRTARMLEIELGESGTADSVSLSFSLGGDSWLFFSPGRMTHLTTYNADGTRLAQADQAMPEIFLDIGAYELADVLCGGQSVAELADREDRRRAGMGALGLIAFGQGAGTSRALGPLLTRALTLGQQLAVAFHPRLVLGGFEGAPVEPGDAPAWLPAGVDAAELRIEVSTESNHPLFRGSLVLVDPRAPLGLCGGLIGARLVNADDPSRAVSVRLLGAARGTGARVDPDWVEMGDPKDWEVVPDIQRSDQTQNVH